MIIDRVEEGLLPDDQPVVVLGSCRMDRADHQLAMYNSLLIADKRSSVPVYLVQVRSSLKDLSGIPGFNFAPNTEGTECFLRLLDTWLNLVVGFVINTRVEERISSAADGHGI